MDVERARIVRIGGQSSNLIKAYRRPIYRLAAKGRHQTLPSCHGSTLPGSFDLNHQTGNRSVSSGQAPRNNLQRSGSLLTVVASLHIIAVDSLHKAW